ncbi:type IV pilus biogenesis/stability protein PilW [Curvibacter sp. CHRR-16]|uniref:type IV pilus biogenesis/stability protein PilW n=1 Tax=Curvibacter sp. CHRR-16 TaxID=2835872 RepID=UPI001BDA5066|nr:type IV pilus biogenesis/stability protein PilW [Curvibacter sp. CHRR-16]MBT0570637.1 type IV pilus biogenesis/stability protein PilW [Curvibacter sp. CHRR-16]
MQFCCRWKSVLAFVLVVVMGLTGCASSTNSSSAADGASDQEGSVRKRSRVRMELALGYFSKGQTEIALEEINQAIQTDVTFAEPLNVKGLIYMRLNNFKVAEDNFRKALQLSPKLFAVQHNLGWLYCQQGRYDESFQQFKQLLSETTYFEKPKTLLTLGVCQAKNGGLEEAQKTLQKAFELDSVSPVISYQLASVLYQRQNFSAAQFYLKRINESDFAMPESLWLGVKVERKLGNVTLANVLGERLKNRFPQSTEYEYLQRGQYEQ